MKKEGKTEQKKMKKWVAVWEALRDEGWGNFISKGLELSVRGPTRQKYRAGFSRFVDFCVRNNHPFALESLQRFLHACRRQGAKGTTLDGYRCGVLWVAKVEGLDPFAADRSLVEALKGYKYEDKLHGKPRGAITEPMLEQLMERGGRYALSYATAYHVVLRVSQLKLLSKGDVSFGRNKTTVTIRRDKRANARSKKPLVSTKEVLSPAGIECLRAACAGKQVGEKLFPDFNHAEANETIHEVARICGWPEGLTFDGMHCLRHGGAQSLKQFIVELMRRMGEPAAMCEETVRRYTRLNEQRTEMDDSESSDDSEEDEE